MNLDAIGLAGFDVSLFANSWDAANAWQQAVQSSWLLAIDDPDVLGQMRNAWNNFIESGQVWALIIGLFLGYIFRSFTAY
ncbi:hypothetical protein KR51_00026900 [Rubidibacter lacunae KORDI 51-2]|uniref:Uncharacterized protein n=1 Tax=Rubidibacter lacunae KORDI 51-2 TaxID=582515 RepID=U5DJF4_9CHRO|nr:hypothetical protein [Rubidibacter lacunae]ERN40704.1 hypothetical protein KR51_00026900 [Rubidibacter lacunae KORDI 51-2]